MQHRKRSNTAILMEQKLGLDTTESQLFRERLREAWSTIGQDDQSDLTCDEIKQVLEMFG